MNTWVTSGTLDVKGVDKEAACLIPSSTFFGPCSWQKQCGGMTAWLGPNVAPGGVAGYWFIFSKMASGEKVRLCLLFCDARKKSTRVKSQAELIHPVVYVKLLLHFVLSFLLVFFLKNHSFVSLCKVFSALAQLFWCILSINVFKPSCGSMILLCLFIFIIYFSKNKGTENSPFFPFRCSRASLHDCACQDCAVDHSVEGGRRPTLKFENNQGIFILFRPYKASPFIAD